MYFVDSQCNHSLISILAFAFSAKSVTLKSKTSEVASTAVPILSTLDDIMEFYLGLSANNEVTGKDQFTRPP